MLAGVLAEAGEELYVMKNADKIFKVNPADGSKFLDRFKRYNLKKFEVDVRSVLFWPTGLVYWLRGIKRFRNMSEEDTRKAINAIAEKFEKEGFM